MKHHRRIQRDLNALDKEKASILGSNLEAKIKNRKLADVESRKRKLLNQLLEIDDKWDF